MVRFLKSSTTSMKGEKKVKTEHDVSGNSYPDRIFPVKKVQVRAGRKVELWFNDLMRTTFKSIGVTLNHKIGMTGPIEKERRYIPQPCPKVWKKRGGSKTTTSGTAMNHLAVLKEMKRGSTLSQVNIAVLGQLVNANTGERSFFGSYTMVIRLEAIEGPNYVLPFDLTVVTSHNNGNNTTCIDIPVHCGFDVEPTEEEPISLPTPTTTTTTQLSQLPLLKQEIQTLHITPYDTNNPTTEVLYGEDTSSSLLYPDFIMPVVGGSEEDPSSDYLASGTPSPSSSSYASSPEHASVQVHDLGYLVWEEDSKQSSSSLQFQFQPSSSYYQPLPQPHLPSTDDHSAFLSSSSGLQFLV